MKRAVSRPKAIALTVFFVFCLAVLATGWLGGAKVDARPGGSPPGYTGAPGEADCTDCHSQNAGPGSITIGLPASYVPGQTYTVEVRQETTDTTRRRWGFQLTSLRSNNSAAGTFANTSSNTQLDSDAGRNYVNQTSSGTFRGQTLGATWTFNWTAPATDVGPVTFYTAGLMANDANGDNGDRTVTTSRTISAAAPAPPHQFTDFDGDGKSDPAVFRPTDHMWYLQQSTSGFNAVSWGESTDKLTPADFDGDNRTDIAVWREGPPGAAAFYILESNSSTVRIEQFGQTGDDPSVVGDWDGDGTADLAVYRDSAVGSQSYFYYKASSNNPGGNITYLPWGTTNDRPIAGDFDGDGKRDLAVFRQSNGIWYIRNSSNSALVYERWGLGTDNFVVADYDGDGKADPAVFRDGIWYIKQSSDAQVRYETWGLGTDKPVPADYDGDAKSDVAVYRDGVWYLLLSTTASMDVRFFGTSSDKAVQNSMGK